MSLNRRRAGKTERPNCCDAADSGLPLEPQYSEDGVDLTVIRWMLSMTPEQRLETLQNYVRTILRIRGGQTDTLETYPLPRTVMHEVRPPCRR